MSKFFVPKPYDATKAEDGVWFSVYDKDDTLYGEFKLKYVDQHSKAGELAYKRVKAKYATQIRTKALSGYDSLKVVLCELHLLDWKLPTDPNDTKAKPVPFSLADALEYFSMDDTKWIAYELSNYATEPTNFKSPEEIAEVVAGE